TRNSLSFRCCVATFVLFLELIAAIFTPPWSQVPRNLPPKRLHDVERLDSPNENVPKGVGTGYSGICSSRPARPRKTPDRKDDTDFSPSHRSLADLCAGIPVSRRIILPRVRVRPM
ncbi:hypothetical protein V8E53_013633, partial [Lactarius tabidus]